MIFFDVETTHGQILKDLETSFGRKIDSFCFTQLTLSDPIRTVNLEGQVFLAYLFSYGNDDCAAMVLPFSLGNIINEYLGFIEKEEIENE